MITPQELELIRSRKKPNAIAARAIIRRGTGHKYWSSFGEPQQRQIEEIATDLNKLIFNPPLQYPIKSADLPAGGNVYSGPSLRMVYDFITLCVGVPSPDDDLTGQRTIDYLTRCRRVMRLLLSNHPSSLGLHPGVYFYSWTGKQQPILFLVMASLLVGLERSNKLSDFIKVRAAFEDFIMGNRALIQQLIRKFGTKDSGMKNLSEFYGKILGMFGENRSADESIEVLRREPAYSYLQPAESPYDAPTSKRFSSQVKSGLVMKEFLAGAPRCAICGGIVPSQAISIDHAERREDRGSSGVDNAQMTHPYCNTGYKEKAHAQFANAKR